MSSMKINLTRREFIKKSGSVATCAALCGCGILPLVRGQEAHARRRSEIKCSYIFVDHQAPIMVAMYKGEEFSDSGIYLKPVIDKQKYKLVSDGAEITDIEFIVSKSGSEAATLFAQRHINLASYSLPAAMVGIDTGTPMKILGPVHTEGLALVFPQGAGIKGWENFLKYVRDQKEPVRIGYHSPTSAPKMVFEGGLHRAGIKFTSDATDFSADILMVDLRSTSSLSPALISRQVHGWVGPSPHPQVAEHMGTGEIVLDLRELPPQGYWHDFPCCIFAAGNDLINNNPEAVQAFMSLMKTSADFCNNHSDESATIVADWIGIPAEAARMSTVVYTTYPSDNWQRGAGVYLDVLNDMNVFNNKLKGKKLDQVKDDLFDFRFA
ncbi:ABC transporter substrate-binding protein [Desulfonatronovibrio hydrogenovorans]|uniref:ABC transporter substrate-binding protein n=1 Tax=Desulfonatronovibrio hydrogenovorans TaxID=53245 RepID=UPI00068AA447|nr:ABC transporter substrate-binding protein [Desulfonatronovibrio hydrogenovorans]